MEKYKTIFEFWTGVCAHARRGEWDDVRADLLAHNYKMTRHFLNRETFRHALKEGHADILQDMFNRDFSLHPHPDTDSDTEVDVISWITTSFNEDTLRRSMPALRYLITEKGADTTTALYGIAARGDVSTIKMMKEAGCNPLNGHNSFFLAFFEAQTGMMEYLYTEGADLYHPSVLQGLYHRSSEVKPEARAFLNDLLARDADVYEDKYKQNLCHTADMDGYRKKLADGQSVLHIAARAGYFSHVVEASLYEKESRPLTAADLLEKDDKGVCPLAIMAARGDLSAVFNPALWQKNAEETSLLIAALQGELRVQGAMDEAAVQSAIVQHRLRQKARRGNFRLGPP